MRICALTRIVMQHGVQGGMEKHLQILGEGLLARGHDLTILTTAHPHKVPQEKTNWGTVYYLPGTRPGAYWPAWFTTSWRTFQRLHAAAPFDLVLSEGAAAEKYARMKRVRRLPPLISVMHGTLWGEVQNHRRAFGSLNALRHAIRYLPPVLHHAFFWQAYVRNADLLIAVSSEIERRVQREYQVDPARIEVVFNGIDVERCRFSPAARSQVRERLGIGMAETVLMTAGRLVAEKGTHLAISATEVLRKAGHAVKLVIVGDGPQRLELQDMARRSGLSQAVLFAGRIPGDEVPRYLSAADALLMPTLRHEGLPFTILEAMACARPVIVARFPGLEDIIRHGENGLVFTPGKGDELASHILELTGNTLLAAKLAQAGRAYVGDHFTLSGMVSETIGLLEGCADRSRA